MDNQTLGAAIAICGKKIEDAIEGIAGEIGDVVVSVADHKLLIVEKDGE